MNTISAKGRHERKQKCLERIKSGNGVMAGVLIGKLSNGLEVSVKKVCEYLTELEQAELIRLDVDGRYSVVE